MIYGFGLPTRGPLAQPDAAKVVLEKAEEGGGTARDGEKNSVCRSFLETTAENVVQRIQQACVEKF